MFHATPQRRYVMVPNFYILIEHRTIWLSLFPLFFADIACCAALSRIDGRPSGHGSDDIPNDQPPNESAGGSTSTRTSAGSAGPAGNNGQAAKENNDYNHIFKNATIFYLQGHFSAAARITASSGAISLNWGSFSFHIEPRPGAELKVLEFCYGQQ
jgi:hypothetical protein